MSIAYAILYVLTWNSFKCKNCTCHLCLKVEFVYMQMTDYIPIPSVGTQYPPLNIILILCKNRIERMNLVNTDIKPIKI